ncbi:MAG: hypothetical protein ABEJ78_12640, partial [Haloferacaceae archaeon]
SLIVSRCASDDDFLAVVWSFLVEQGLVESELDAIVEETWTNVRRSLPALTRPRPDSTGRCIDANDPSDCADGRFIWRARCRT